MKSVDIRKNTDGEGRLLHMIDAEMRKRRERTGLDTLVVYAVNDVHSVSGFLSLGAVANALSVPPGEYAGNGETQRN